MAFTFAARTLLELGRELISTDEVAFYEIIKNSVDATRGSTRPGVRIRLTAQTAVTLSDHLRVLRACDVGGVEAGLPAFIAALQDDLPATVRLGIERVMRDAASISPDDFRAAVEKAYLDHNWIEFDDDGHGMSLTDLSDIYLRIGTRSRRAENVAGSQFLGDKGVGRLSAMRLGDLLEVRTTRAGERRWNVLTIPWSLFSHDSDLDAGDIDIDPHLGADKTDSAKQGTVIRISGLRADWSRVAFSGMLQGRIARMIDPFVPGNANGLILAKHNGEVVRIPSIPPKLLAGAHATAKVTFDFEGADPVLTGTIDYTLRNRSTRIDARGTEVGSITQRTMKRRAKKGHAAVQFEEIPADALRALGRFECQIYWYNRRVVQSIETLTDNAAQTKAEIAAWSGGPMLYRFGFRVLPYGDPADDWLGLDENAFGAKGFKLNRQQVIGRVRVWSAHTALSEQTNREGLMDSPAQEALTRLLKWLLHVEMRDLINAADEEERIIRREADEDVTGLRARRQAVEEALADLGKDVGPDHQDALGRVRRDVAALSQHATGLVGRLDDVMKEAEDEREKFVYLAGIGLMTEFIFHELERAVSFTIDTITEVPPHERDAALASLVDQLRTLNKRIAAFDELTGEKRQTRSEFDMADMIDTVLSYHRREFERHGFDLVWNRPSKPLRIKAVRGMVIQILENLLTNATYWLKRQQNYEEGFRPRIVVELDTDTRSLTIEDNGPGVAPDRSERIFQPFVTSKPAGQGRGLGLHISRELASQHKWRLHLDDTIGRQRPNRLNMFVLDMS